MRRLVANCHGEEEPSRRTWGANGPRAMPPKYRNRDSNFIWEKEQLRENGEKIKTRKTPTPNAGRLGFESASVPKMP